MRGVHWVLCVHAHKMQGFRYWLRNVHWVLCMHTICGDLGRYWLRDVHWILMGTYYACDTVTYV